MTINKEEIIKTNRVVRILAALVCASGFISILISLFILFHEPSLYGAFFIIPEIWLTHLSGTVTYTGYPPKYLYWTSDKNL